MKDRGRNNMISGKYQDAYNTFKEFLKENQDDAEVNYLHAATARLKQPINCKINFISVVGIDTYVHMGVTAPLGSTLIDVLNDVSNVCKETEKKIENRFAVSEDGKPIGGGFALNWHVLDFVTVKVDMIRKTIEPERFYLSDLEKNKSAFRVPPRAFLEYEPSEFTVAFNVSFSEPPLDKLIYQPQDSLTSVLGQYNTITLLAPDATPKWAEVAALVPQQVPELDIFFQQVRGSSAPTVGELADYIRKQHSDLIRDIPPEEIAELLVKTWSSPGSQKESETKVESKPKDRCPDCNTKISETDIRPDGFVICKTCRKRFKP